MTVRESKWLKNLEIAASLVSEELTVRRHCDSTAASSNASSKGANETESQSIREL